MIESLNGVLSIDTQGNTNIEKALNKECCQSILLKKDKPITIVFKNVNALVNNDNINNQQHSIHLIGDTLQNTQSGKFIIDAQLNGLTIQQLLNMDQQTLERLQATDQGVFKINAEIVNLPIALIDQFITLKRPDLAGLLQEALGPQLNLTLNQTTSSKGLEFSLNAQSALMRTSMEATINDKISLKKPLSITFKITPQLVTKLVAITKSPSTWQLVSPTTAELIVDTFQYPLHLLENKALADLDLTPLALNAQFKLQPASLSSGKELAIDIQQLIAKAQTEADRQIGTITLDGDAKNNGMPFTINLNANITKSKQLGDFVNDLFRNLSIQGNLKGLPIAAFDKQAGLDGQLVQTMGERADIQVSLLTEKNMPVATVTLKSEFIDIPNLSFVIDKDVKLSKPAVAKIYISPSLIEKFTLKDNPEGPRLKEKVTSVIKINKLSFPWKNPPSKVPPFFLDTLAIDADITFSSILMTKLPTIGDITLNDCIMRVSGDSLSRAAYLASGSFSQIGEEGLLYDLLGREIKFTATTNLNLKPNQNATIDALELKLISSLAEMNLTATVNKNLIKFDFDGLTRFGQQQILGSFAGNALVDSWSQQGNAVDFSQANIHLNAKANKLPVAFISAFIKDINFSSLIGDSFETSISADIQLGAKAFGKLAINLRSELLAGSGDFKYNQGIFLNDPTNPAQFDLTLTPEGYATLRQQLSDEASNFALSEPARMTLKLRSLNIPWKETSTQAIPWWKSAIDADIIIDKLVGVNNTSQSKVTLNDIKGHIFSENISKNIIFNLFAKGHTDTELKTSININSFLENGFTNNGLLNKNNLSLNLDATLTNLPVHLLSQFACVDSKMCQKLDAIIGANLDAKIKGKVQQMNGPIFIELKGVHSHTLLDGQISDGTLFLNNNFYAELAVTPQLGKYVLQDLIPFLSGILRSDQPLKLSMAKEGFSIPLRQFAIENISIGSAALELGKVHFSNHGQLAKILSLLTTSSAKEINVWLTPTYFSLINGLFTLQRVDMLIGDRYPIAAWGKVNIPADNVNMVIGLSGAAISKAFNVSGIKKSYVLQLPLSGTMKNTNIDKSKAVARLGALVAQSQGGPYGLVGTALDLASGGSTEETPPPSTTKPLPWSTIMDDENNQTDTATPVDDIKKALPIEDLGRGAGDLFKKIFKKK
ncbi:MAG: hypothetical protein H0X29_04345 [Parachlamydiaceae bacterium]|nr:hypothetical protein [Parachlamydiaceae bacterium]